jgi:hypothetical protein
MTNSHATFIGMLRLAGLVVLTVIAAAAVQAPPDRVPVVVELFTSEGCSSCPPADALLSRLAKDPIAGVQVIPLGMHVTYWDQLGWRDPASLQSATVRQQHYGGIWGGDRVYTPQAVVDGREEMVGSDEAGLRRAIAQAAKSAHAALTLTASADGDRIAATLAVTPPANVNEPLDATFFLTEDDLTTVVKRGENGGRTLHHDAVVRIEQRVDRAAGAEPLHFVVRGLRPEWRRDRLHAVVVLSGRRSHQVFGAASTPLN